MSSVYYQQFEPAWAGRWVGDHKDIGEFIHDLAIRDYNLTTESLSNLTKCATNYSVKTVDTAIAHALREAYRN